MADSEGDYTVSPGKPPLHARFKKGQSGNPGGRRARSLPALLADALNETVVRDDRRTAPQDHQARGDRHADGRQITGTADLIRIAIRSGLVDRDAGLWAALCDEPRS